MTVLETAQLTTPIGTLGLFVRDGVLCGVAFEGYRDALAADLEKRFGTVELRRRRDPAGLASLLRRYFAGELQVIDAIPVDTGGTAFQQGVWGALRRIPSGETWSYARLAAEVGAPSAVRAVGAANGRNPIPVVIPCHRVIASDGTLCGYGGGLDRKRWLLAHEHARFAEPPARRQASLPFA